MSSHEVVHDNNQRESIDNSSGNGKVTSTELQEDIPCESSPQREPPPYVKSLSPEQRGAAERALVRKIDLRLIPTIVIM